MKFTLKSIGEYEGKLDEKGESAIGKWKQGGASLPLTLKKVAEASRVRRPQTPKPPFPYVVGRGQLTTAEPRGSGSPGTLTLPEGDGPFPVRPADHRLGRAGPRRDACSATSRSWSSPTT